MGNRLYMAVTLTTLIAMMGGTANAQSYTVADLGALEGVNATPYGINNSGHVVGGAEGHGFLYIEGVLYDLHDLVSPPLPDGAFVTALGIDDLGQIAGSIWIDDVGHAFFFENGSLDELDPLPGYPRCAAYDVNESGVAVGHSDVGEFEGHVFRATLWQGGIAEDLGKLPQFSESRASAVNANGDVVGSSYDCFIGECDSLAVRWRDQVIEDLGLLPGFANSSAGDINDLGQVVCQASNRDSSITRAYLWTETRNAVDLGELPGRPHSTGFAINNHGQIVGSATAMPAGILEQYRAFLWEGEVMRDLNDLIPPGSGWVLVRAMDINDAGQIVGIGFVGESIHGFLLEPVNEIPTLSTWGMLVLALLIGAAATIVLDRRECSSGDRHSTGG